MTNIGNVFDSSSLPLFLASSSAIAASPLHQILTLPHYASLLCVLFSFVGGNMRTGRAIIDYSYSQEGVVQKSGPNSYSRENYNYNKIRHGHGSSRNSNLYREPGSSSRYGRERTQVQDREAYYASKVKCYSCASSVFQTPMIARMNRGVIDEPMAFSETCHPRSFDSRGIPAKNCTNLPCIFLRSVDKVFGETIALYYRGCGKDLIWGNTTLLRQLAVSSNSCTKVRYNQLFIQGIGAGRDGWVSVCACNGDRCNSANRNFPHLWTFPLFWGVGNCFAELELAFVICVLHSLRLYLS